MACTMKQWSEQQPILIHPTKYISHKLIYYIHKEEQEDKLKQTLKTKNTKSKSKMDFVNNLKLKCPFCTLFPDQAWKILKDPNFGIKWVSYRSILIIGLVDVELPWLQRINQHYLWIVLLWGFHSLTQLLIDELTLPQKKGTLQLLIFCWRLF